MKIAITFDLTPRHLSALQRHQLTQARLSAASPPTLPAQSGLAGLLGDRLFVGRVAIDEQPNSPVHGMAAAIGRGVQLPLCDRGRHARLAFYPVLFRQDDRDRDVSSAVSTTPQRMKADDFGRIRAAHDEDALKARST